MSDTPRTDAAQIEGCELGSTFGSYFVPSDIARELERDARRFRFLLGKSHPEIYWGERTWPDQIRAEIDEAMAQSLPQSERST